MVDNKGAYVTSGAGALVMSYDQLGGTLAKDRTFDKVNEQNLHSLANVKFGANTTAGQLGHSYQRIFTAKKSGFTLHTFNEDYSKLTTKFMDTDGSVLHS